MACDVAANEPPSIPTILELRTLDKAPAVCPVQEPRVPDKSPAVCTVRELCAGDAPSAMGRAPNLCAGDTRSSLLVVMLMFATTMSMGMNTQRGTILEMVYTLLGAYLSRASKTHKLGNNVNSQGYKRQPEKTLKEHSGFCHLGLPLFVVMLVFGTSEP
ncbi:uncharacterized protein LOC125506968 [Triticum urartu]|uniref:uncharacterized protein LOC125506968 n=1 Tax=Triticum urartu TaxID=4572 RepID=UPI0020433507|nr:uncharacterized protein LOC125506968 [Triticum urartu]